MEEKKLTDEEVIKALDFCYSSPCCGSGCPYFNKNGRNFCMEDKAFYKALKDLIHRLQADNIQTKWNYVDLKERYVKVLDLNEKVIAEQNAEIERLKKGQAESAKTAVEVLEENLELQKQVDELKESANGCLLTSLYKKQADDHKRGLSVQRTHWEKKVQQAVKDTAKEIIEELDLFFKGTTFRQGYEFKKIEEKLKEMAKRNGVEVE